MVRRAMLVLLVLAGPANADPVLVERVVARVDGKPIYLSEIRGRAQLALSPLRPAERAGAFRRTHRALLEQRIEREILLARAARERVEVTPAEVAEALQAIARENGMDLGGLLAAARQSGFDESAYRKEIAEQLIEQRLVLGYGARRLGAHPKSESARTQWLAKARVLLLREARRRAWVERWVRW